MENSSLKKILVVEDEKALRDIMAETLRQNDFQPIEAHNGVEGFETALKEHPDLILLDRLMPQMDGVTMLGNLRESGDWGKHVPVIILSNVSLAEEKDVDKISKLEPSYYLVKADWPLSDVIANIREVLRNK